DDVRDRRAADHVHGRVGRQTGGRPHGARLVRGGGVRGGRVGDPPQTHVDLAERAPAPSGVKWRACVQFQSGKRWLPLTLSTPTGTSNVSAIWPPGVKTFTVKPASSTRWFPAARGSSTPVVGRAAWAPTSHARAIQSSASMWIPCSSTRRRKTT